MLTILLGSIARAQSILAITPLQNAPYAAASEASGYVRFGAPITFSARIMPADATGTVIFSVDGTPIQTVPVARKTLGDYVALGDSITASEYIGDPSLRYQSLLAQSLNLTVTRWAAPGFTSCDAFLYDILPNGPGLTTTSHPLYSLLIGANDLFQYGVGPNEALFDLCHRGAISWLGLARPYKILAGDPGVTVRSGNWILNLPFGECCTNVLTSANASGTVRFALATNGGAAFLWYVLQANTPGSFAVSVDGGAFGAPLSTLFPTTLDSAPGTYALLRLPVPAGTHTFDIAAQSGSVSILGMGAAPPAGSSSVVPTVLVSDVPNQIDGDIAGIAEYTSDIKANIALLQGDGLDVRFVPTQNYMFATPAEMVDAKHPNPLGLSELAHAFQAAITPANPVDDTISVATASFTINTLAVGNHVIGMVYSGDAHYAPVTAALIGDTIYDGSTTSILSSDAAIYPVQAPITLTAEVPSNEFGEVDFLDVTTSPAVKLAAFWLNQPSPNPVTLTVPSLAAGIHKLQVDYLGDFHFNGSTSPTLQIDVSGTYTATSLTAANTHFTARSPVTLTASVAPASVPGTFTFLDGAIALVQAPSVAGAASFSTSSLAPGIHSLTAAFSGNSLADASQSPPLPIEIDPDSTLVALAASPASQPYGGSVALLATISPTAAGGTIALSDAFLAAGASQPTTQALGQPALASGTASLNAPNLLPGTHTFTAIYSGDTDDLTSTSQPASIQIALDPSTTILASIPASISYGTSIQLAAAVTPSAATGTVSFSDSAAGQLAQVALANGGASLTAASLAPGPHSISATYSGDTLRGGSFSPAKNLTVNRITSAIVLAPLPTTIYAGNPLSLAAAVSPASAAGTVIFRDATLGVLGSAPVTNGAANLALANPVPASYSIAATYSGDTFDAPSTSSAVTAQVILNPTSTSLATSAGAALAVAPIALTATVSPNSATGTITFFDGTTPIGSAVAVSGTASISVTTLAAGSHTLHAAYSGNSVDAASTSASVAETIAGDTTSTTLTLAQASLVAGSTAIANIQVGSAYTTPTGTVTLRSGSAVLASGPLASASTGVAYATLSFSSGLLGLGTSPLVASYSGDSADLASSATASEIVLAIPTTLSLTLSSASAPVKGIVTLTGAVGAASIPAGSVTFLSNGTPVATVPLNASGIASTTFTAPALGSYTIAATYMPTGLFAAAPAIPAQILTVSPIVSLSLNPAAVTGGRGSSESATLLIAPNFGFTGPIETQCQTSVVWISCAVNAPSSLGGPASVPVQIAIAQTTSAISRRSPVLFAAALALWMIRRRRRSLTLVATLLAAVCITACGATPFAVPSGPESATVTVTAAGSSSSAILTVNIAP